MNLEFLIKYAEAKQKNKKINIIYYKYILYVNEIKTIYNDLYRNIDKQIKKTFIRS
jgi:hypothetical protein